MSENKSKIPSGIVTFLFTDIEGSTKHAQEYPEQYPEALKIHNSILRNAVESNNGFVFKTIGDAFCNAFFNGSDAVKAAYEIQKGLSEEIQNDINIKVRIGIHCGNAEWNGNDYMGYMTLARTSRIMSAANGEQTIISDSVTELINKNELTEFSFKSLGERRLKDVTQSIRLYQLIAPDIREDFPPLNTLDVRPNNLPVQLTSFIGREEEIKIVKDLLNRSRLLTIIGAGGSGKTRLALQTGADLIDDFNNGVYISELASLTDHSLIVQTLMDSIGIKEEPGISPKDKLKDHLKKLELLLILDNCEHLILECAELAEYLLSNCPKLKILATSREALNCSGEHTYKLPSLALPDNTEKDFPEKLIKNDSVRLFTERALSVNSNFRINKYNASALAEICSRLDGIPLAIELAAARLNILSIEKINERLNDRFRLLSGGKRTALPRQKTLKALIDWSYDLLSENEKILWQRVSVFSGGWTLDAAEEIIPDENILEEDIFELLSQLTDKSILSFNTEKSRYSILETIKEYGIEKLRESNEESIYRAKHLNYYMELSKEAEPKLLESEMQLWLDKLESEHGNFQAAIIWAAGDGNKEEGAWLAGSLGSFWEIRGHNSIGIQLLENINKNFNVLSSSASAKVLLAIGILSRNLGYFDGAQKSLNVGLKIYRDIKNKSGVVNSLNNLGILASDMGDYELSKKYHEESMTIGNEIGDKSGIAVSLNNLGTVSYHQGNVEQAKKYYEESLKLRREIGYKQGIAICLNNLGSIASRLENFEQAKNLFNESLSLSKVIGDKIGIGMCLNNLGGLASSLGNFEQAQKLFSESVALWRELSDKLGIVMSLNNLGILESNNLNYDQAKKHFDESLKLSIESGDKVGLLYSVIGFSGIVCAEENFTEAVTLQGAVETAIKSIGIKLQTYKLKLQEQILKELHEKMSEDEFAKYFEVGEKLSLEQAADLILNDKL